MSASLMQESVAMSGQDVDRAIEVMYDASLWVCGYCREIRKGSPEREIDGWVLHRGYLRCLRIPMADILEALAHRQDLVPVIGQRALDFWKDALYRYAYCRDDGWVGHAYPGTFPELLAEVEELEFRPRPKHLPFCDMVQALRRCAHSHGMKLRDALFRFQGVWIRTGTALANAILTHDLDPGEVATELARWRDGLLRRIEQQPMQIAEAPAEYSVAPEAVKGRFLPRPLLAKHMQRNSRTLDRWDALGMVPSGVQWFPGQKVSGNLVVYDLEQNWPAIKSMMRDRDAALKAIEQAASYLQELASSKEQQ